MVISLITDFGNKDYFVGVMKGVILSICPNTNIVDISHEIEPHNIDEAGFVISKSYNFFPAGTVHLVVVDPGVGSSRKILMAKTKDYFFVMPDNGIISWILKNEEKIDVFELKKTNILTDSPSSTFHGRDIMAPVAAKIASEKSLKGLGIKTQNFIKTDTAIPKISVNKIEGQVIYYDHFGNLITNIHKNDYHNLCKNTGKKEASIKIAGKDIKKICKNYSEGTKKKLNAIWGSHEHLELFLKEGNAKADCNIDKKEKVEIIFKCKS
ncbi:MAG: hypothetical protein D6734_00895 [Candidatus Schekmanbacteria bacterium]|nr:MAG: hypothetical protein D6734_00895 [Candidatus Schekmanbacteria bacterium]